MFGWTVNEFEGFDSADFEAFENHKWRSHRFNLERMRVSAKLEALGKTIVERTPEIARELETHVAEPTPTIFNDHQVDCGWLCFKRPPAEQRKLLAAIERSLTLAAEVRAPHPLHKELLLAVRVDHEGLEISLRLHAQARLDVQNIIALCEQEEQRAHVEELLRELPPTFECRLAEHEITPADAATNDNIALLRAMRDRGEGWLIIRRRIPIDSALLAADTAVNEIVTALAALFPLRQTFAWRTDNDHLERGGPPDAGTPEAGGTDTGRTHPPSAKERTPEQTPIAPATTTAPAETLPPQPRPRVSPAAREPISDDDRRPAWAKFTPRPRPARQHPPQPRRPRPDSARQDDRGPGRQPPKSPRRSGAPSESARPAPTEQRSPRNVSRPAGTKRPRKEFVPSDKPLAEGCHARITDGLFKGQVGKLITLDSRGNAQLLVHKKTLRIESGALQRIE